MRQLIELGVIPSYKDAPRGFSQITRDQFRLILKEANANESLIID